MNSTVATQACASVPASPPSIAIMRLRLHPIASFRLTVFCFWALATTLSASPALTNWQVARVVFQQAGAAITESNLVPARVQLAAASTNLPVPYRAMATGFSAQLEAAARLPNDKETPSRSRALVELCAALGAYDRALKLQAGFSTAEDLQDDPAYAWRLFETGQVEAALAEYRRRIKDELVDTFADHFREQLRLLNQRATNRTDVIFSLRLVKEHYLRGFEEKADFFGALQELNRVLPSAKNSGEAVLVIAEIIQRLSALSDTAGRDAWEDQLLARHASEIAACANVHLERGSRAFSAGNYSAAMASLRKVATEYANTPAWGDAQYTLALVHQTEARYTEAIAEYQKIFPSPVRDHEMDVNKSDDAKNYRHRTALRIAECYAAQNDFANALSYAEAARDKYPYVSYCKNCLRDAQDSLLKYIGELKAKLAAPPAAKSN